MEISDQIIVINEGQVEQSGTPDTLYDRPVNDFVMGFLGPVTTLGGNLVRPHDIHVSRTAGSAGHPARIERLVSLGFETRLVADPGPGADPVTVQLTRNHIHELALEVGDQVYLSVSAHPARLLTALEG